MPPTEDASSTNRQDYLLIGGGLQNALIALSILERQPHAKLTLVEKNEKLGGNHTWCCHEGDIPPEAAPWLEPLFVRRWSQHDVAFPNRKRRLSQGYAAVTSERLDAVVSERITRAPNAYRVQGTAQSVSRHQAVLRDGRTLRGELVVDARGPERQTNGAKHFQKFLGQVLRVRPGTAPSVPMLMDATVPQRDGFRFVYVLPFTEDTVLVEDTYYSDTPDLDEARLRHGIASYAANVGMQVDGVVREERGALPLPLRMGTGDRRGGALVAGYAGGFFHPTTGYSFPIALRLALYISERPAAPLFDRDFERLLLRQEKQQRFCCWLNRLLFGGFSPSDRYHVLERFYGLPELTIQHFYALEMTTIEQARILCGRPPPGFSPLKLFKEGQYA